MRYSRAPMLIDWVLDTVLLSLTFCPLSVKKLITVSHNCELGELGVEDVRDDTTGCRIYDSCTGPWRVKILRDEMQQYLYSIIHLPDRHKGNCSKSSSLWWSIIFFK